MERLHYGKDTQRLLEDLAENDRCYWRYQLNHHNGLIPIGHQSTERIYAGEAPEYIEEGCSCYDNPYQLLEYMGGDVNQHDMDKYEVVLFTGTHKGYGLDEEDIVKVEKEEDVMYSLSAKDFFRFCLNADIYCNSYNLKEAMEEFTDEFIEAINA